MCFWVCTAAVASTWDNMRSTWHENMGPLRRAGQTRMMSKRKMRKFARNSASWALQWASWPQILLDSWVVLGRPAMSNWFQSVAAGPSKVGTMCRSCPSPRVLKEFGRSLHVFPPVSQYLAISHKVAQVFSITRSLQLWGDPGRSRQTSTRPATTWNIMESQTYQTSHQITDQQWQFISH